MKKLYVLYDGQCPLCQRSREWFEQQEALIPLQFIPFQSDEAKHQFPNLDQWNPADKLVAIDDNYAVYQGEEAWIQSLYALKNYRTFSKMLAHSSLKPLARHACELISENRLTLSRLLKMDATALRASLEKEPSHFCKLDGGCE